MNFTNFFKKTLCHILLYTILISNSSILCVFANNSVVNETTQSNDDAITDENPNEENVTENEIEEELEELLEELLDPLGLVSGSAVLIDAKSGVVLYDKDMNVRAYPASMTKVMTTILALENTSPDDILTHSEYAVTSIGYGTSNIGMRTGEEITMEQALHGVMLASANEVSMAVAEEVAGSGEDFAKMMTARARAIGTTNTNFMNPHGLHDDDHYTTPYDMALILREAIQYEEFVNLISSTTYTIPTTNLVDEERYLYNSNRLISKTSEYYYEKVVGGKTGYTTPAGNTLVTYAKYGDIELIACIMQGSGAANVYSDTKKLFDYGFSQYELASIFDKSDYSSLAKVAQTYKENQIDLDDVYVTAKSSVLTQIPNVIDRSEIEQVSNIRNPLEAPVYKGDTVGTLNFNYRGNTLYTVELIAENTVLAIPLEDLEAEEEKARIRELVLSTLKKIAIGIVSLVVGFILLVVVSRTVSKHIRRNRRRNRYNIANRRLKRGQTYKKFGKFGNKNNRNRFR